MNSTEVVKLKQLVHGIGQWSVKPAQATCFVAGGTLCRFKFLRLRIAPTSADKTVD